MTDPQISELGKAITEVSEKASLLVREEIALAKAELTEKVTGLAKGAAVGAAAGIFILAGLIYFLHFVALGIAELLGSGAWLGYLIVSGILFLSGGLAGFLAVPVLQEGLAAHPDDGHRGGTADQADAHGPASRDAVRRRDAGHALERGGEAMSAARTPEEIRASIEANRAELAVAVESLRGEVAKATDWRGQLRAHKREVIIGAAVAGFVVGGGIAAFTGLLTGRRSSGDIKAGQPSAPPRSSDLRIG